MKKSAVVVVIVMGVAAQACVSRMPDDFAFRFEYGTCTTDILDTFQGVFVRDLGDGRSPISTPVQLAAESTEAVHNAVVAARFAGYPSEFRVSGSPRRRPAMHYRLEVEGGGQRHTVAWFDDSVPSTSDADRLRELFKTIERVAQTNPDVSKLQKPEIACR